MIKSTAKQKKILRIIKDNAEISRVSIAKMLGVSKAAVCDSINSMLEEGILLESGEAPNGSEKIKKGRRRILLKINENYRFAVGMTVTKTSLNIGISTLSGKVLDSMTYPLAKQYDSNKIPSLIVIRMQHMIKDNCLTQDRLLGIGISFDSRFMSGIGETGQYFESIKSYVGHCFSCPVICADFVYAMSFMNIEFTSDLNVPVKDQLFICITDKIYMTIIRNGEPAFENTDRFNEYLLYDRISESYKGANDLILSGESEMSDNSIGYLAVLVNNLLCVFKDFNMIIYSPDFTQSSVSKLNTYFSEKCSSINEHMLIYSSDKSRMFLGSCAMAVNKFL